MLCDFQKRRFQQRWPLPDEELDQNLVDIERAILLMKTKLNAALARSRIRARVLSVDSMLPDTVRENERISSGMRIHCWVNRLNTTYVEWTFTESRFGLISRAMIVIRLSSYAIESVERPNDF